MVTGYPPMYSEGDYKKVVPVDPQEVLVYFSQSMYKSWPDDNESMMYKKLKLVMDTILTKKENDAVKMVLGEGLSYGKTGKYLGINRKSVESIVRRAVAKIKRCF
jgi:DNA-directed RNA polymerase specialized sigma24 family protein